jgi:hypothetical protein
VNLKDGTVLQTASVLDGNDTTCKWPVHEFIDMISAAFASKVPAEYRDSAVIFREYDYLEFYWTRPATEEELAEEQAKWDRRPRVTITPVAVGNTIDEVTAALGLNKLTPSSP